MTPETAFFILALYISFRLKQLTCDFLMQTGWMALSKGYDDKALLMHAFLHGIGTFTIVMIFAPGLYWLGLFDMVIHGVIDRLKATLTLHYKLDVNKNWFWWAFGLDQEAHNFTHLAYIIIIIGHLGMVSF